MANYIYPSPPFPVRNETSPNVETKLLSLGWLQQDPPPGEPDPKYWKLDTGVVVEMTQGEKDAVDAEEAKDALVSNIIDDRIRFKRTFLLDTIGGLKDAPLNYTNSQVRGILTVLSPALDFLDHGLLEDARDTIGLIPVAGNFTAGIRNNLVNYIQNYLSGEVVQLGLSPKKS